MISAEELVRGDVVRPESGDKVLADLRLRTRKTSRRKKRHSLASLCRRESVPTLLGKRNGRRSCKHGLFRHDVVSGRATGLVVATGSHTELGRINELLTGVSALETPLLRQIKKSGYAITAVVVIVGVSVSAYGKWLKVFESSSSFRLSLALCFNDP